MFLRRVYTHKHRLTHGEHRAIPWDLVSVSRKWDTAAKPDTGSQRPTSHPGNWGWKLRILQICVRVWAVCVCVWFVWLHQEEKKIRTEQFLFFCFSKLYFNSFFFSLLFAFALYFIWNMKTTSAVKSTTTSHMNCFSSSCSEKQDCWFQSTTLSALCVCVAQVQQMAGTHGGQATSAT